MARLDDQRGTSDHLHQWDADYVCEICHVSRLVIGQARLEGALMHSESAEHALHSMQEARALLADVTVAGVWDDELEERRVQAVAVLDRGIADARYALNETDQEPPDPLEKLT